MKTIGIYVTLVVLLFQVGCGGNGSKVETSTARFYRPTLFSYSDTEALMIQTAYKSELDIELIEYYKLNLLNYQAEKMMTAFQKRLYILENQHDTFDPDYFVALNSPSMDSSVTEIGLFEDNANVYTPLIQNSQASLLYHSIQDDLVVYCLDRGDTPLADSVHWMRTDGSPVQTISLGVEAVIADYYPLGSSQCCIDAYNAGSDQQSMVAFMNVETQEVSLLMEPGKDFQVAAVLDHAVVIKESEPSAGKIRFFVVDVYGRETAEILNAISADVYETYQTVVDTQRNLLYIGFTQKESTISIVCYDLESMQMKHTFEIETQVKNTKDALLYTDAFSSPFYIHKETGDLSFILRTSIAEENYSWYIANAFTQEIRTIDLPTNAAITLSSDGKYVLVVQTHGKGQNNGIVSSETEDFTLVSEPLKIHHLGHFYNPQMEEFIVVLRENIDGNTLYRINPKGEIQPFTLD